MKASQVLGHQPGIALLAFLGIAGFFPPSPIRAQENMVVVQPGHPPGADLANLSLESLAGLNVVVTSSAKKAESLRDATSAIYVITSQDIRDSGIQDLADLFRMVPGVQVVRNDASEWGVSARGFNAQYNDKMLVLIDGRSLYENNRAGVIWREDDLPLQDIDRIEVIRGPGGTLWGSNAVNGVINIITKDSKITQGFYASAIGGSEIHESDDFRYGGKIDEGWYYRVYGKTTHQGPLQDSTTGGDFHDDWNDQRVGFRSDWDGGKDRLTLQGDFQQGLFNYADDIFNPESLQQFTDVNTNLDQDGNLLARWTQTFSDTSEAQLQAYYEVVHIQTNDGQLSVRNTADVEFQHRFPLGDWNEITWGGDFRNTSDDYRAVNNFYLPAQQSLDNYGLFLQDKASLIPGRLYVTGGAKVEKNPYTGDEILPSGRILFTPDENESLWAAVSRAARVPDRFEESVYHYRDGSTPPLLYEALVPNTGLLSEELVAYELGYRAQPVADASLDIAAFYNRYYRLISNVDITGIQPSPIGGQLDTEGVWVNTDGGAIYGVEGSIHWAMAPFLKADLAYSYQDYDSVLLSGVTSSALGAPPPHNLFSGRLTLKPLPGFEVHGAFYFNDTTFLPDSNPDDASVVQAFTRMDLGATLQWTSNLELSVWGQNLGGTHTETLADTFPAINIGPSVYGQVKANY